VDESVNKSKKHYHCLLKVTTFWLSPSSGIDDTAASQRGKKEKKIGSPPSQKHESEKPRNETHVESTIAGKKKTSFSRSQNNEKSNNHAGSVPEPMKKCCSRGMSCTNKQIYPSTQSIAPRSGTFFAFCFNGCSCSNGSS